MSNTLETKIARMEQRRGTNHGLSTLRNWLLEDFHTLVLPYGIHIAGTNGKGSVTTWLEVLLAQKQQSTGAFVSPHLLCHNERLHLNGKPVSLEQWEKIYDAWDPLFQARSMTMFEMDLWMALSLFEQEHPEWILMETGLGGRRDATTACRYPWGIITQTGMDHMALLGETKEQIAAEKAGIIEPGMEVVTAETDPACLEIFEKVCQKQHATLHRIDRSICLDPFWNPSLAEYQKENFLCALKILQLAGFSFSNEELQNAARRFHWGARFQILRKDPLVLLDGAHNPDGIEALCRSLKASSHAVSQIYFSVLADKQAPDMIRMLQRLCSSITLVFFDEKRLYDLKELAERFNIETVTLPEMMERLQKTDRSALICGSLYFAGAVLQAWQTLSLEEAGS